MMLKTLRSVFGLIVRRRPNPRRGRRHALAVVKLDPRVLLDGGAVSAPVTMAQPPAEVQTTAADEGKALLGRGPTDLFAPIPDGTPLVQHTHVQLDIIINGEHQVIPAGIGLTPGGALAIHTHDSSGVIHVESPVNRPYRLDDFFAVWGQEFSGRTVLGHRVAAGHRLTMTVNGRPSDQFDRLALRDGDSVVINYGPRRGLYPTPSGHARATKGGSVHASAAGDCPSGWVCLFEHNNFRGRMKKFREVTRSAQALSPYDFNDETSSWINRTNRDAVLYKDYRSGDGRGATLRLQRGARSSSVSSAWNDEASAIRIL